MGTHNSSQITHGTKDHTHCSMYTNPYDEADNRCMSGTLDNGSPTLSHQFPEHFHCQTEAGVWKHQEHHCHQHLSVSNEFDGADYDDVLCVN